MKEAQAGGWPAGSAFFAPQASGAPPRVDRGPARPAPGGGQNGLCIRVHSQVDGQVTESFFRDLPIRIGRNRLNDLVLNHPYVSQWHAVIGSERGALTVTQVGSTNAVVVGERKLMAGEEVAVSGDTGIRIVPFELELRIVQDPASFPPASQPGTHSLVAAAGDAQATQTARATIALQILNRLSQRFLGRTLDDPRDLALFGARMEETLEVFLRCFIALQRGKEQLRSALDIRALAPDATDPVEQASDPVRLAAVLLGPTAGGAASLERSLKDLMIHQVALLNGTMAGVRNLLGKVGPKAVRKLALKKQRAPGWRLLWETFEQVHRELAEEEEATFETVFGRDFDRAYAKVAGKKSPS